MTAGDEQQRCEPASFVLTLATRDRARGAVRRYVHASELIFGRVESLTASSYLPRRPRARPQRRRIWSHRAKTIEVAGTSPATTGESVCSNLTGPGPVTGSRHFHKKRRKKARANRRGQVHMRLITAVGGDRCHWCADW